MGAASKIINGGDFFVVASGASVFYPTEDYSDVSAATSSTITTTAASSALLGAKMVVLDRLVLTTGVTDGNHFVRIWRQDGTTLLDRFDIELGVAAPGMIDIGMRYPFPIAANCTDTSIRVEVHYRRIA